MLWARHVSIDRVVENLGEVWRDMKMRDNLLEVFFRRERVGQFVVRIENAGVLNPSNRFDFPSDGISFWIQNCASDPCSVSLRGNIISHVVAATPGRKQRLVSESMAGSSQRCPS